MIARAGYVDSFHAAIRHFFVTKGVDFHGLGDGGCGVKAGFEAGKQTGHDVPNWAVVALIVT